MKAAYVQCSPISVSYANLLHLEEAMRLTGAKRVFLCVWDAVAFEDPAFFARSDGRRSRTEQVQENAHVHQRFLESRGAEVHMFYLSEAWARLFSKPNLAHIFNAVLSKIKLSEIIGSGLPDEDLTLSRINYTIADILVATYFHKIFPEISAAQPGQYVTSRRPAPFMPAVKSVIKESGSRECLPDVVWVSPFLFLMDSHGLLPSIEMNERKISEVVSGAFLKRVPDQHEVSRLYSLMGLEPTKQKNELTGPQPEWQGTSDALAHDLHRWFMRIKKNVEQPIKAQARSIIVANPDQFHRAVRPLSAVKLRILSLCDGTRTSYHIAKALGLKQVTVSVYIGRLRALGLISEGRRPSRTVSSLIVDLDAMAPVNK